MFFSQSFSTTQSESVEQIMLPLAIFMPRFLGGPMPFSGQLYIFTGYLRATSTVLSELPLSTTKTSNNSLENPFEKIEERVNEIVEALLSAGITTESISNTRSAFSLPVRSARA